MADAETNNGVSEAGAAAGGPVGGADTEALLTEEQRLELARRRAMASAVDDADASHQGGMGAQGGAVDFGQPKNFGLPR